MFNLIVFCRDLYIYINQYFSIHVLFKICILVVSNVTDEEMQEHYDNFFEDVFVECEDKVKICLINLLLYILILLFERKT